MYFTNGTTYFYTPDEAKVYKLVNSSWEMMKPTFDMMARMAPHLREVTKGEGVDLVKVGLPKDSGLAGVFKYNPYHDAKGRFTTKDKTTLSVRPNWGPRNPGESDKAYAKRVIDKGPSPKSLPEDHGRYFLMPKGTKVIPLGKLRSTKSDAENAKGGLTGPKRMWAAYHGKLSKRAPITVTPNKKSGYDILDGNGTYTSAKKLGWKALPVLIKKESISKGLAEVFKANPCHEPAGSSSGGRFCSAAGSVARTTRVLALVASTTIFRSQELTLPAVATQPVGSEEGLYSKSKVALEQLWNAADRGDGVASEIKARIMDKSPEALSDAEWDEPGPMLFMAPLKSLARAKQKVRDDYGGDWSRLTDVVRGTIAVDRLDEVASVIDKMRSKGLRLARKPKNRIEKPTPQNYRDMLLNFKTPNGMIVEMQVNLKQMMKAKNIGHKFYEEQRSISRKYKESAPTSRWSKQDAADWNAAFEKQKKIYGEAWERITKDNLARALTKKVDGYAEVFKSKMSEYRYYDYNNTIFRVSRKGGPTWVWYPNRKEWYDYSKTGRDFYAPIAWRDEVSEEQAVSDWGVVV